jgi:hypothetical protein
MPQSDQYNSQGYDQHGFRIGPGYREPVQAAEYTPTGNDNQQILDSSGAVIYQGVNFETHSAGGYNQHGILVSGPKIVTRDESGITNGAGYNMYGVRSGPTQQASVNPYLTNGAGYSTDGSYGRPMRAPVNVFMVNGAGYTTSGVQVAPFYSGSSGGVYGYGYPRTFEVDLYGSSRGTNYRFGLNDYGLSFDLNGRKGNTAWSASFR